MKKRRRRSPYDASVEIKQHVQALPMAAAACSRCTSAEVSADDYDADDFSIAVHFVCRKCCQKFWLIDVLPEQLSMSNA